MNPTADPQCERIRAVAASAMLALWGHRLPNRQLEERIARLTADLGRLRVARANHERVAMPETADQAARDWSIDILPQIQDRIRVTTKELQEAESALRCRIF